MKQIIHRAIPFTAETAAPTGEAGINLSTTLEEYTARSIKWLITVTVETGPSAVTLWGSLGAGVAGTESDDVWGKVNDKYGDITAGVLAAAQADGTQHYIVEDLGIYTQLYLQKSAGTVTAIFSPIMETKLT